MMISMGLIGFCVGFFIGAFWYKYYAKYHLPCTQPPPDPDPIPPKKRTRRPRIISNSDEDLYKRELDSKL